MLFRGCCCSCWVRLVLVRVLTTHLIINIWNRVVSSSLYRQRNNEIEGTFNWSTIVCQWELTLSNHNNNNNNSDTQWHIKVRCNYDYCFGRTATADNTDNNDEFQLPTPFVSFLKVLSIITPSSTVSTTELGKLLSTDIF